MVSADRLDRDQFQRLIGARDECICQLERQLAVQHEQWHADAREWKRLLRHRDELAEWLIDQAANEHGRLMKSIVDSGLSGEMFVPCTFHAEVNGRRYQISLVSTDFEIVKFPKMDERIPNYNRNGPRFRKRNSIFRAFFESERLTTHAGTNHQR